jgi:type IV secretion system protein VirD4
MHNPTLYIRVFVIFVLVIAVLALGYPAAFVVQHGWNPAAWPADPLWTPTMWLQELRFEMWVHYPNVILVEDAYRNMLNGTSAAFADGGVDAVWTLIGSTLVVSTIIFMGGKYFPLRDKSGIYGRAEWASPTDIARMNKGLEIGLDPETGRAVRIQVQGNLVTIAPPRMGKTQGFIIPNLVLPETNAWAGPTVVIDPKGDVYRAVKRRREAMGKTIRCLDPLNYVGGTDRWNPLPKIDPHDVLYLQSMAFALLPTAPPGSDSASEYFRSRAVDMIVAAILASIANGRADMVSAARLLTDQAALLEALENRTDDSSVTAREILTMDQRSRDSILSTVQQATQWLRDERTQAFVQNHTFELSDLASGDVDLFIVLPADDRKSILAPYVRWLLADLFTTARQNRLSERIIVFLDEAYVLGRVDAFYKAAGELPGYGISLWSFWQSRQQMIETYGSNGADTLCGTAEMMNVFKLPAVLPDELEHWSKVIGTYTGIKVTTGSDSHTNKKTYSSEPVPVRLVPASDLTTFLDEWQYVSTNSLTSHTTDPIKLRRTLAYSDDRFAGLIDSTPPVGESA